MTKSILLLLFALMIGAEAKGQQFNCKHRFTNTGFDDENIFVVKLRYGNNSNSPDTLWIGKERHFILCCGDWHGWTKRNKIPVNASKSDGYALCQDTDPKNGRAIGRPVNKDWYWMIYLDDICGHKLYRVTHVNFKTNQYIAYLK